MKDIIEERLKEDNHLFKDYNTRKTVYFTPKDNVDATSAISLGNDYIRQFDPENPFLVFQPAKIDIQVSKFKEYLPMVEPFYAIKSNNDPNSVRHLAKLGVKMDCSTPFEMHLAMSMGTPPEDIIYTHPVKMKWHLLFAKKYGINYTVFDSEDELYRIKEDYSTVNLFLRIQVDDQESVVKINDKYGARSETWERLLDLAKELGLNIVGISFHSGFSPHVDNFYKAIDNAKLVYNMAQKRGFTIRILDIGGGFAGKETFVKFSDQASIVKKGLNDFFSEELERNTLKVIAEPGRYFTTTAYTAFISIIGKKQVTGQLDTYYANDGSYGSFSNFIYENEKYELSSVISDGQIKDLTKEDRTECILYGPTCCSTDCISKNIMLPRLKIGDWISIDYMGQYSLPIASTFNGFPLSKIVIPS